MRSRAVPAERWAAGWRARRSHRPAARRPRPRRASLSPMRTGTICDVPGGDGDTGRRSRARRVAAHLRKRRAPLAARSSTRSRLASSADGQRRRRRRREDERPRALDEVVDRPGRPGDEGAADAQRLARRVHREEDAIARCPAASMRPLPRSPYTPTACASSTIRCGAGRLADLRVVGERRFIAVHAEQRLDNDETLALTPPGAGLKKDHARDQRFDGPAHRVTSLCAKTRGARETGGCRR